MSVNSNVDNSSVEPSSYRDQHFKVCIEVKLKLYSKLFY
jgi:hypothetical protein